MKADTNTDYSSALHLAPKPGGGIRPCTDFRSLNAQTVIDAHPLPLLKDFTSRIHGAKWFSVIDLRSAFFNVPIWPPHRHKTLTLSPWGGSYIYNRLAFGLASGPSTWQKLLEHTLRGVDNCFIYLDDVLCFGKTKASHDKTVESVLKRLAENDMALSLDKCKFGKNQVTYLGYSVSESGIKPLKAKLESLQKFKTPESKRTSSISVVPLTTSGQASGASNCLMVKLKAQPPSYNRCTPLELTVYQKRVILNKSGTILQTCK